MPISKVLRAELLADSSINLIIELSHLEPGEKAVVQTTAAQGDTIAEATALVTGAAPAGKQRISLVAVPRGGAFDAEEPLMTFSQATTVWTTQLKPTAPGTSERSVWATLPDDPADPAD